MGLALVLMEELRLLHELLFLLKYDRRLQDLGTIRSLFGIDMKHLFNDLPELNRIRLRYPLYFTLADSFVEAFHG